MPTDKTVETMPQTEDDGGEGVGAGGEPSLLLRKAVICKIRKKTQS